MSCVPVFDTPGKRLPDLGRVPLTVIVNCCSPQARRAEATNRFFSRFAKRYSRTARRNGLDRIQRDLVEGIAPSLTGGARILEIGCGVGALHQALLGKGAVSAVGVDISEGMLGEARRFASDAGLAERTEYLLGDFTDLSSSLQSADVTILDKVVCCYPEVDRLVDLSTKLTKSVYALSFPRDRFGMRLAFRLHRFVGRLLRWEFYPCWHVWSSVRARIEQAGFSEAFQRRSFLWEAVVYRRTA